MDKVFKTNEFKPNSLKCFGDSFERHLLTGHVKCKVIYCKELNTPNSMPDFELKKLVRRIKPPLKRGKHETYHALTARMAKLAI